MEFFSHALADGVQRRINNRDGSRMARLRCWVNAPIRPHHTAHRVSVSSETREQAGTFGMHRGTGSGQFVDLPPGGVVGGRFGGDENPPGGTTARPYPRAEFRQAGQVLDHFSPGGAQHLGVFGVAEYFRA